MDTTVTLNKAEGSIVVTSEECVKKFLIRKELVPYKKTLDELVRKRFLDGVDVPDERIASQLKIIEEYKRKRVRDIMGELNSSKHIIVVGPSTVNDNVKDTALFDLGWVYLLEELIRCNVRFI